VLGKLDSEKGMQIFLGSHNLGSLQKVMNFWQEKKMHINPSYSGGRVRKIVVQGRHGQKVSETLSPENKPNMVVHICNLSYSRGGGKKITQGRP
jgi:hypothetical protein